MVALDGIVWKAAAEKIFLSSPVLVIQARPDKRETFSSISSLATTILTSPKLVQRVTAEVNLVARLAR